MALAISGLVVICSDRSSFPCARFKIRLLTSHEREYLTEVQEVILEVLFSFARSAQDREMPDLKLEVNITSSL